MRQYSCTQVVPSVMREEDKQTRNVEGVSSPGVVTCPGLGGNGA